MSLNHTVSVVIPTFNRAAFLIEAIKSVLSQTVIPNEIVVIDDGSTDGTADALKPYSSRLRYIWQTNSGPSAARNRGLREVKCEWVAFLDSDDVWVPQKQELQLKFLDLHRDVDVVFGDMATMGEPSQASFLRTELPSIHEYLTAHASELYHLSEMLFANSFIPTPTVMFRRNCVEKVGLFDETLRYAEDLDYWLRLARHCRFGYVDSVVMLRRRHPGNLVRDWAGRVAQHLCVLERLLEHYPPAERQAHLRLRAVIASMHYDLGSYWLKLGAFRLANRSLARAYPQRLFPLSWAIKRLVAWVLQPLDRSEA